MDNHVCRVSILSAHVYSVSGILILGYFFGGISIMNEYLGLSSPVLLIIIIGIAIIISLVSFALNYVKRNNDIAIE